MFCPACGKENPQERRFCAFCGTNLEIVSRALYNHSLSVFTRIDIALDKLIGRYCERVFKNPPGTSTGRKVSDSWKLLGAALLTLGADFVLFWLMLFLFLPLRLITLFVTTPVRLLLEKANRGKAASSTIEVLTGRGQPAELASSWLADPKPSVVEVETEHFPEPHSTKRPAGLQ